MSPHYSVYRDFVKPLADRCLAAFGMILIAPLLALIAIVVRCKLGSPVLFTQTRTGKHGRPFQIYKFRTMTDAQDFYGNFLPDGERLSPFGRWLRSTSFDELPELWNVLRGDMSLVGPRPLLMEYLPHYSEQQARRHDVLPGLTGWAQVQCRNATTWSERFSQDAWYVENLSLLVDLLILWRTLSAIVTRRGISAGNHATMPRFDDLMRDGETRRAA